MIPRQEGLALPGKCTGREPGGPDRKRVLLIDYDDQLADILAELLRDDGLEVIVHNCPADDCNCVHTALGLRPDAILINVAQPAGSLVDTRGWQCLLNLKSHPLPDDIAIVGYSIFDSYALSEMGVDGRTLGLRIRTDLSNPGQFADEIAHALQTRPAA